MWLIIRNEYSYLGFNVDVYKVQDVSTHLIFHAHCISFMVVATEKRMINQDYITDIVRIVFDKVYNIILC